MDFLKDEIDRKRKQMTLISQKVGSQKYIKRGDAEKLREEQYLREQELLEKQRAEKKLKLEQSLNEIKNKQLSKIIQEKNDLDEQVNNVIAKLEPKDIIKRLRSFGHPIRLFGETNEQQLARLRDLEAKERHEKGQTNELQRLLKATDKELTEELLKDTKDKGETPEKQPIKADTSKISQQLFKTDPELNALLIMTYLKELLKEWGDTLQERSEDEKSTAQGKLQTAIQAQTAEYLKPLFKKLKKNKILSDVHQLLTEMVVYTQQREYIKANDAYIRLSIGNAPWPIGVTSIGL